MVKLCNGNETKPKDKSKMADIIITSNYSILLSLKSYYVKPIGFTIYILFPLA